MSPYGDALPRLVLRHGPQRHALMLPPGHPTKKYDDRPGPITSAMLARHLAGEITLAAPAIANDLGAVLPLDIDGGGMQTICALLDAAHARGLRAWGEYHHRDDWADDEQRGYVWVAFDQLVPAAQLQELGRLLIAEAAITDAARQRIECRAHQAVTRLPFAKHTHTGRFGALLLDRGHTWIEITPDPQAAYECWASADHSNSVSLLPELAPEPLQTLQLLQPHRPSARSTGRQSSVAEIKQLYNEAHDLGQLLQAAGGKRFSATLYHCPCGQHAHGDRRPSLLLKPAHKPQYGATVAQGYSPTCRFASGQGQVWDAFNVYAILHGLSFTEMLAHARQVLGLDPPERPRSRPNWEGGAIPQPRPQPRPSAPQPPPSRPSCAPVAAQPPAPMIAPPTALPCRTKGQRLVLTHLQRTARHGTSSVQSTAQIAAACDLSERHARRVLHELVNQGALSITPRTGQTNIYTLLVTAAHLLEQKNSEVTSVTEEPGASVAPIATSPASQPDRPADMSAPEPVLPAEGGGHLSPTVKIKHVLNPQSFRLVRGGGSPATPAAGEPPAPSSQLESGSSDGSSVTTEAELGASFTPVDYSGWPTPREWPASVAPKEYYWRFWALDELEVQRSAWFAARPTPPPAEEPAPVADQAALEIDPAQALTLDQAESAWQPAGAQALRAELARIEQEARRQFARKATAAGIDARRRARLLRQQLAELEQVMQPVGMADPATQQHGPTSPPPLQARPAVPVGQQSVLEVVYARDI